MVNTTKGETHEERVAIVVARAVSSSRDGGETGHRGFTVVGTDRSEKGLKSCRKTASGREVADPADPVSARSVVDRIAAEVGTPE